MKKWKYLLLVSLVAQVLGITMPLHAGVVFQLETVEHADNQKGEWIRLSLEGSHLLMELSESQQASPHQSMIFLGDLRVILAVDHANRTFTRIDRDSLYALNNHAQENQTELQKRLYELPPEQRILFRRAFEESPEGSPDTGATGEYHLTKETTDKHGYTCVKYDVIREDHKSHELWITEWENITGGQEQFAAVLREMASLYQEMLETFAGLPGNQQNFAALQNPFESFQRIKGFPIETRVFEQGNLVSEMVVRQSVEKDIEEAVFQPPKGYKMIAMSLP